MYLRTPLFSLSVCVVQFSSLYIVSFVVITLGFVLFNAVPTCSPLTESGDGDGAAAPSSSDRLLAADGDSGRMETLAVAAL